MTETRGKQRVWQGLRSMWVSPDPELSLCPSGRGHAFFPSVLGGKYDQGQISLLHIKEPKHR